MTWFHGGLIYTLCKYDIETADWLVLTLERMIGFVSSFDSFLNRATTLRILFSEWRPDGLRFRFSKRFSLSSFWSYGVYYVLKTCCILIQWVYEYMLIMIIHNEELYYIEQFCIFLGISEYVEGLYWITVIMGEIMIIMAYNTFHSSMQPFLSLFILGWALNCVNTSSVNIFGSQVVFRSVSY